MIEYHGMELIIKKWIKILTDRKDNVNSRISGCLYSCDVDLEFKIKNISNKYLYSNPLHPDIYPGLIKDGIRSYKNGRRFI